MRLAKRHLAFLLSCSLMISSSPAEAGFMDQEVIDRLEFLEYAALFLWVSVSTPLKSYILGNGPKPDSPEKLEEINNLWNEHQVDFTISQTTFFVLIRVCAVDGAEYKLKPEELQKIAEIAPGLSTVIEASYHHEVHLPISGTMLGLLVAIVRGEDTDDAIFDLLNGYDEELQQLVDEVKSFKCKKIIELLQEATRKLRRKIVEIAPGLATPVACGLDINTQVTELMLSLLVQVVRGENSEDSVAGLSNLEREELIEEAKRIKCEIIASILEETIPRTSSSARTTPNSSPRTKKTNHNGEDVQSHTPEKQPIPIRNRERRDSIHARASDLSKTLIQKSKDRKKKKAMPIETELVHVTENLISSDGTPLEQLFHFASSKRDNNLLCHYYPIIMSDDDLRAVLKNYRTNRESFNFAQALITSFEEQGFPNGPPSMALQDLLREILQNLFETRLGGQLKLSKQCSLSHTLVTTTDLDAIFMSKYADKEIAAAWTQSNVNLFRNLKPKDIDDAGESSLTLLSASVANTEAWIANLIENQPTDKARQALLGRLIKIASYMLKVHDYHGAFMIHRAFQTTKIAYPILQGTDKGKMATELMREFAPSENYKLCRDKIRDLRSLDGTTFLSPALFYLDAYARTKTNAEAMNPSDRIMALGTFLQMVHNDKLKAPRVENINAKLLNLFMGLPFLEEKK